MALMRPALRLAINSASGRRSRTLLLVGAAVFATALVTAVSCAVASVNAAIELRLTRTVGDADVQLVPIGGGRTLEGALLDEVRTWPEVEKAEGRLESSFLLQAFHRRLVERDGVYASTDERRRVFTLANGFMRTDAIPPLLEGRAPEGDDEIVIDALLAMRLSVPLEGEDLRTNAHAFAASDLSRLGTPRADVPETAPDASTARRINRAQVIRVGDEISVYRIFRDDILKVVGIAEQPPLGGRPQAYMTLDGLETLMRAPGRLSRIDLVLAEGIDPTAFADAHADDIAEDLMLNPTAKVTSGVDRHMRTSQLGMVLLSMLAFLSASFIIMTGLSVDVLDRQRVLAMLRCIGATPPQLGAAQLFVGAGIGGAGAIFGVPLGIGLALALTTLFSHQLSAGLAIPAMVLVPTVIGSFVSGILGAAWPAWRASTMSPLAALAVRSRPPQTRHLVLITAIGLGLIVAHALIVGLPDDGQIAFWGYATVGLPAMFTGYFLLGVPAVRLASALLVQPVGRMLRLPTGYLRSTLHAAPFRHGFTAGAMMAGLALMVALWTNGGAIMRDWLDRIQFPDAFVNGPAMTPEHQAKLNALPFVEHTCAISLLPVETDAFGVKALQKFQTTFIAFQPEPFFEMTTLTWIEGSEAEARRRLDEGGAIIVAKEFRVAQGLGVGDTFAFSFNEIEHEFEIVGVITSPGLEVASKFFNIGAEYAEQSVHAIFGTRRDLEEKLVRAEVPINLFQIDLDDKVDEAMAIDEIRTTLAGTGILDAGSGRQIKEEIRTFTKGTLLVVSVVAIASMIVACFGVANLIIAGIEQRRFSFGVLRAVGGQRGLLVRLVVGEVVVVASGACLVGTLMGLQAGWAGQRMNELLMGLTLTLRPPLVPIAIGWSIVFGMTLVASIPAILRLNGHSTRDLLAHHE